jgi:DNA-directed RNA polymerase specialized sigma24 family protein
MGSSHNPGPFSQPTQWSLILRAKGEGPEAGAALEELVRTYWKFLTWLMRVSRHPPDVTPDDLAQEFLLNVVRRRDIAKLDPAQGSFHGWLRKSVKNFLCNEWKKRRIRERHDWAPFDVVDDSMPEEDLCNRMFMAQVLAKALELTREQTPDARRFAALVRFLPGPQLDFTEYGPLAAELGLHPKTLTKAVFDLRARFERNLDALIREAHDLDSSPPDGDGSPAALPGGSVASAVLREKRALLACLGPFTQRARPLLSRST